LCNLVHRVSWLECGNSHETLSWYLFATFCPVLKILAFAQVST
jgi:hypothetical protein